MVNVLYSSWHKSFYIFLHLFVHQDYAKPLDSKMIWSGVKWSEVKWSEVEFWTAQVVFFLILKKLYYGPCSSFVWYFIYLYLWMQRPIILLSIKKTYEKIYKKPFPGVRNMHILVYVLKLVQVTNDWSPIYFFFSSLSLTKLNPGWFNVIPEVL